MSRKPSHQTVQKNRQKYAVYYEEDCGSYLPVHLTDLPYEKDAFAIFRSFTDALGYCDFLNDLNRPQ